MTFKSFIGLSPDASPSRFALVPLGVILGTFLLLGVSYAIGGPVGIVIFKTTCILTVVCGLTLAIAYIADIFSSAKTERASRDSSKTA